MNILNTFASRRVRFFGKNLIFKGILALTILALVSPAPSALAQAYINISSGGNSLSISVSGAGYSQPIDLVYTLPGSSLPTTISNIGTAYGGSWNGTLNLNEYGIVSGSQVYVNAGGHQSNTLTIGGYYGGGYTGGCTYPSTGSGPYGNCGSPYGLSLSQNNVYLNVGQSQTVTAYPSTGSGPYGNFGSSIYISSNSNSSAVSVSVSGSQISLYGLTSGSSTISVCSSGYSYHYSYGSNSGCASLYVSVSGSVAGASAYNVSIRDNYFSPQTITIPAGSSITWRNDGSMAHTVTFDSPYSDSGTIFSGSVYTKTFLTAGTYTYRCRFHPGMVGEVVVTGGGTGGQLTFSQSNISLNQNQSLNISIYGTQGTGSFYISNNTNPGAVNASIAGSTVYLLGQTQGSSTITVCQNNAAACGSLYVTVYGSGGTGTGVWFSQSYVNLGINQSQAVNIYSSLGTNYYLSSNSNSNAINANVIGNTLNLYGRSIGSANLTVCHSTASNVCGTLYASVGGGFGGNFSLSQNSLYLSAGQSAAVTAYNHTGSLYISSSSNPAVAGASISGNAVNIYASNPGSTTINVCQNNSSQCVSLPVTVSGYSSGSLVFSTTNLPTITLGQFYSYQLPVSGGTPPYAFTLVSGQLPPGLSLSSSGVISGTVANASSANFTVRVSDNFGRTNTANFYLQGIGSTGGVLGASIYKNGQLIKEGGTIYIVYRNTKSGFANWSAFSGFGFKLSNIIDVGNSGLNSSGYIISTANASHPWGSWIKSGQTVYFVHETGLIPVPDWNTFLNNSGQGAWIVNANLRDFSLPILSPMTLDDMRLK